MQCKYESQARLQRDERGVHGFASSSLQVSSQAVHSLLHDKGGKTYVAAA